METKNVFEETVNTLVEDANSLTKQYNGWVKQGEHKKAIDILRLLKDTLALIKEYDWHLEYSENEDDIRKEVSVWEQNHNGDIKNQKTWNVADKAMYIVCEAKCATLFINSRKYVFNLEHNAKELVETINELCNKENLKIYVDDNGYALGEILCDILEHRDIKYDMIRTMKTWLI